MHNTQKSRKESLDQVRKTIAKNMPKGIEDSQIKAVLSVSFGFSPRKVEEYLSDLQTVNAIEEVDGKWKMAIAV